MDAKLTKKIREQLLKNKTAAPSPSKPLSPQKELEFALDTAQLGYWNLNLETGITERSLLHDQIFGYSTLLPTWTYQMFLEHVHPEDIEIVDKAFKKAIANDLPWEFEYRIYRADDKSLRWLWASGSIVKVGETAHMLGLVQDITERKNNEEAKAMLLALEEFSDEAIIGKDLNGTVFSWNKAAEKLYGYTPEEIKGRNIQILFPKERTDEFKKIMRKVRRGEQIKQLETLRVHKKGHTLVVSVSISPIKNSHGKVIGATASARDISEQKLILEELKHLAEHDALTGLINRHLFEDRLDQAVSVVNRQKSIAVCFLDIDDFKKINDEYGHAMGDFLLCAAAKRIQKCLRTVDTLARLGGDEFGLILPNISNEEIAMKIAKRLIKHFSKAFIINNKKLFVTMSIGIAMYPKDGHRELIEKADLAMYHVKKNGKNNVKLFN